MRPLPLGARRPDARRPIRDRVGACSSCGRRGARGRRRRAGRRSLGRALPHLPLRASPLGRRRHPGHRGGSREPAAAHERPGARSARPRSRAVRADTCLGARRARRGGDVELQLGDLLADHPLRPRRRVDPPADGRAGAGLALRCRRCASCFGGSRDPPSTPAHRQPGLAGAGRSRGSAGPSSGSRTASHATRCTPTGSASSPPNRSRA